MPLAELVAVKIVDKTKLTAESLQQHNLEVKLLSRLSEHEHPNIVRLYQVINTKSKLYLVMGEGVLMCLGSNINLSSQPENRRACVSDSWQLWR